MERLSKYPFHDSRRAQREIQSLSAALPENTRQQLASLLMVCPAPELALNHFETLRERHPVAFKNLTASGNGLRYLTTVFSHSRFLSEEILEHPTWARTLVAADDLEVTLTADE